MPDDELFRISFGKKELIYIKLDNRACKLITKKLTLLNENDHLLF